MSVLAVLWATVRATVDWRIVAGATLAVSLLVGAYAKGHGDASAACRAADLARQLATKTAIANRLQQQAMDANDRAAGLEAEGAKLNQKVSEYERSVRLLSAPVPIQPTASAGSGSGCFLDGGDADRLRAIR